MTEEKLQGSDSREKAPDTRAVTTATGTCDNKPSGRGSWCEAQSPEGYTYYWNDVTGGKIEKLWENGVVF